MTSYPGIRAEPRLADALLTGAQPASVGVRYVDVKTIHETGRLARREFLAFQEDGLPYRLRKREFTLRYTAIRDCYDLVEEILAGPGPFDFVMWKHEHLVYLGDGVRTEFTLPWRVAAQVVTSLPGALPAAKIQPVVKVTRTGAELTYSAVTAGTYAGTPTAGNVWFLEGAGLTFKLASAPALDAQVHVRYVPVFEVLERGESEKTYTSPTREPRDIVLVET